MIAIMWQFDVSPAAEMSSSSCTAPMAVDRDESPDAVDLGSSFLHDQNRAARYIVIEYWSEIDRLGGGPRATRRRDGGHRGQSQARLIEAVEPFGSLHGARRNRNAPARPGRSGSSRDPAHLTMRRAAGGVMGDRTGSAGRWSGSPRCRPRTVTGSACCRSRSMDTSWRPSPSSGRGPAHARTRARRHPR